MLVQQVSDDVTAHRHHTSISLMLVFMSLMMSFTAQKMLDYLKEKRDVGFFKSLSGLMQSCRCSTQQNLILCENSTCLFIAVSVLLMCCVVL